MSGPHGIKNARRWPESGKLSNESSSGVLTASKFDLAAGQNPKIHTQFTCIVLAVPRFYWRIFALENLFHGYQFVYFKCNAKIARWQWAEMNYVWGPTPHLSLQIFGPAPPPPLGRFCIFEPPLRWRYIVPLCSIVRVHFALHSHSLLLPRGGRQINQWQRDFIVSLTEILPL